MLSFLLAQIERLGIRELLDRQGAVRAILQRQGAAAWAQVAIEEVVPVRRAHHYHGQRARPVTERRQQVQVTLPLPAEKEHATVGSNQSTNARPGACRSNGQQLQRNAGQWLPRIPR